MCLAFTHDDFGGKPKIITPEIYTQYPKNVKFTWDVRECEVFLQNVKVDLEQKELTTKYKSKKIKKKSERGPGRPRKYSDDILERALQSVQDEYVKTNDQKAAWNKVASTHGFPTHGAAKKTCQAYEKRRINYKSGKN